jgi:hypothetical protein
MPNARHLLPALAFAALSVLAPSPAAAQCPTMQTLTNGVSQVAADPSFYAITSTVPRWYAVGVRTNNGSNWKIDVADNLAPFPTCFADLMSTTDVPSGVEFEVVDGRHRSLETDYMAAYTQAPAGNTARIEFEQNNFDQQANRTFDHIFFGANDVLTVREANLVAGVNHQLQFVTSAGATGLRLFVFAPVASGSGWVPRSGRVIEQALTAGSGDIINFTPTVTGYYAIVVTNEDASAGDFWFAVRRCPFSASTMTDNNPFISVLLDEWPGFTPTTKTWNVVGVRGQPGSSYNLDVSPGFRDQNGFMPLCDDSTLASQFSGLGTRIIAGDFRSLPLRFYTGHMGVEGGPTSNAEGWFEWEKGDDAVVVNDLPLHVNPVAHNVFDAWSVTLVEGATYAITLTPDGGATNTYTALLFANPNPGTGYWAARPDAAVTTTSSANYVAPATGLYGLVVLNDNAVGTGGYSIAVTSDLVAVDPGAFGAVPSHIRAIAPSPTFAGARIEFALERAGRVGLRVADVAGRTIAELDAGRREAGKGAFAWNGRNAAGMRPPASVYFVTLTLDGAALDRAKMIVLR